MRINELIPLYIKHLHTLGRSYHTIKGVKSGLRNFVRFLEEENIDSIENLTIEVMEEYQQDLAFYFTGKGTVLTLQSQSQILSAVRGFTCFLKKKDYLVHDPGERIKMPKTPKRLPKVILNQEEVSKLLNAPDTRTNKGYRDKIILEILYDTAMRRAELATIKLTDLDLDTGYIRIRGKGDKDRVVPVSQRVCGLIRNYLLAVRQSFLQGEDKGYLILNRWGVKMDANGIWAVVKRCAKLSKFKKNVSTHAIRHSCATHMLKNGAPIRHIQEMLGHASLETTQIYTHVTINDLKEIHSKYHPGEKRLT